MKKICPGILKVTNSAGVSEFELGDRFAIGSSSACEVQIDGAKTIHCVLSFFGEDLSLQCLNPVELNGESFDSSRKLKKGDVIKIADTSLEWLGLESAAAKMIPAPNLEEDAEESKDTDSREAEEAPEDVAPKEESPDPETENSVSVEVLEEDEIAEPETSGETPIEPQLPLDGESEQEPAEDSSETLEELSAAEALSVIDSKKDRTEAGKDDVPPDDVAEDRSVPAAEEEDPERKIETAIGIAIGTAVTDVSDLEEEASLSSKSAIGEAVTAEMPARAGAAQRSPAPTTDRRPRRRPERAPAPPPSNDEEIFDLVSTPGPGAERNIYSWILLIVVIIVSLGVAGFAWQQKSYQAERVERDKLREELKLGAYASVLKKSKALLAEGEPLYKKDLEELRDRSALLDAMNDLNTDPLKVHTLANKYVLDHENDFWRKRELSMAVREVYRRRITELQELMKKAKSLKRAKQLKAATDAIAESLTKNPLWLHVDDRSRLGTDLDQVTVAFNENALSFDKSRQVKRVEKQVTALIAKRNPIRARTLVLAFLKKQAEFAGDARVTGMLQSIDKLEKDILRFRPPSALQKTAQKSKRSWLRPLTRRSLKTLPQVLDEETPVFFTGGSTMVALNPSTGKARWIIESDADVAPAIVSLETRDAYVAWTRRGLIQVLLMDGRVVAQCDLGVSLLYAPVFFNSFLYAPCSDGLLRVIDLETGRLLGQHSLTGRLMKEINTDPGTERVIVALSHDSLAILSPKKDESPELIRGDFKCLRFGVAPLLVRDYALTFENLPDNQSRMSVFARSKGQFEFVNRFEFEGWIVRSPILLNGRLVVTSNLGCVYPFTINTVDRKEGVSPNYDVTQDARKIEGETLVVAQMTMPNFLYFGGQRIERKILNEKTGWWSRERIIYQNSPLPNTGIVHKPFQITDDRLAVTSLESKGDGLLLTSMDLDGRRFWQLRAGLPLRQPFFVSDKLYYQEQGGAVFEVEGFQSSGMAVVQPSLANNLKGPTNSQQTHARPMIHRGRKWIVRPGTGDALAAYRIVEAGQNRQLPAVSEINISCKTDLEEMWTRSLGSPIVSEILYLKGRLVFATKNGLVRALEMSDGKEFTRPFPGSTKFNLGPLKVSEDRVVVGGNDGSVRVLELKSGANVMLQEVTRSSLGRASLTALERTGNQLWVGNAMGRISLLTLSGNFFKDGQVWQLKSPVTQIVCDNKRALVTTEIGVFLLKLGQKKAELLLSFNEDVQTVGRGGMTSGHGIVAFRAGKVAWIDLENKTIKWQQFGRSIVSAYWYKGYMYGVSRQGLIGRLKEQ
ncbi:MAG: PQQ-binding-like beta-propeller repeat protein [Planctomycetota bacterium]|nr:PQQ-binding-like beta-propeller repeat protein [Planctomycetota bacterium]